MLVQVIVGRHPIFQRQDYDIYSTAPITFAQAALGAEVRIKTIDGDVMYTVKPGTQTDTRVRLRGKGVPTTRNKQVRGDHYVTLVVQVPTKMNAEQKELLKAFDQAMDGKKEEEPRLVISLTKRSEVHSKEEIMVCKLENEHSHHMCECLCVSKNNLSL